MPKISIIIPCYNEENRLNKAPFLDLLHFHNDIELILVNDGSKDKTLDLLEDIRHAAPDKVVVISLPENKGKANAVFKGFEQALSHSRAAYIGYLDADLSTGFEEFLKLAAIAERDKADYIFGSRIKMLHHHIYRSALRHFCGRIIATLIGIRYKLYIYDTQCGAKLFTPAIVQQITRQPFHTRWLFDVEIFLRIRSSYPSAAGIEVPLGKWVDPGQSKISIWLFPQIGYDLFRLIKHYKSRI
jgi:glycosyltransferase involved in cell wall biosynthesis